MTKMDAKSSHRRSLAKEKPHAVGLCCDLESSVWVQTDAAPTIWAAGCHFSTQLARPHAAGGGKQVLRPPPLKIASTAEHVHRVATRAREGHGGRKVDTKDADETGEARSTAPRAGRRGGR